MENITGVILAGGRSKRMGVDKATLEIRGETLFERQLNVFREVFPHVLIAGDRPDLAQPDVPSVPDLYPGSALGGLYTGLVNAGTSFIFAAPCDMPFPDANLIRFIVSYRKEGCDAVVPRTAAGAEPLFAVYSRKCLPVMKSLLEEGNYRILDVYERVNVLFIEEDFLPPDWERALLNINTLENLEHIMLDIELETPRDRTLGGMMPESSMLTFDEALVVIHRSVSTSEPVRVSLEDALGTVAAEDIHSSVDLPPADSSAMDGYAFAYLGQRKGDNLPVAGMSMAGEPFVGVVQKGQVVKIMTGGIVPQGCDTVIPFEEVEESPDFICLKADATPGINIRFRGEEGGKGEILVQAGTLLDSREIGMVAAGAVPEVKVIQRPRVALLTTGTELTSLGEQLGPGRIVNSNHYFLSARLRELGCDVLPLGTVPDDMKRLKSVFTEGLEADAIISTGGVSVGDRDLVHDSLSELGFDLGFWGVRMRPGKPVLFGTLEGKPIFGLPGNPAACGAVFELFVVPALERLAGTEVEKEGSIRVIVTEPVRSKEGRDSFVWGLIKAQKGNVRFIPNTRQGSGQNRSMAGANALLRVPPGLGKLRAGWEGEAYPLKMTGRFP